MSLLSGTSFATSTPTGTQQPYTNDLYIYGVANNLSWSATGLNSTYIATISLSGIDPVNDVVQSVISVTPAGGDFSDAVNCWLVSSYLGSNSLNFIVAGNPASPSRFPISWLVTRSF